MATAESSSTPNVPVKITLLSDSNPAEIAVMLSGDTIRLSRPLPAAAAVQIERGEHLLLAEVTHSETDGQECTVHLAVKHVLNESARSPWFDRGAKRTVPCGGGFAEEGISDIELWEVPSAFGKLLHVTLLRERSSGQGRDHVVEMNGNDDGVAALHVQLFREWLSLSLREQKADLDSYFSSLDGHRRSILEQWLLLAPHHTVIPAEAEETERALYLCDIEALASLLRNEYSSSAEVSRPSALKVSPAH